MRATVKLVLRNDYVRKDGKQQLCLRYIAYQKDSYIGLGISILPKHWDAKALMVRAGEHLAHLYNKIITRTYEKAKNLIMNFYEKPLPIPQFRKELFDKKDDENTDFYQFVEQELKVLEVDRAKGTIANYKKLLNTMKEWKPTLHFYEITLDFIEKFHAHEIELGNLESTVNKKHANFKFLIGRAVLKEKIEKNPYERFVIKKKIKAQNEDVLTEQEIDKLHEVYKQNTYSGGKQKVLRNFLFSCYTSLSYAEFDVVTYADLKKYIIDKKEYLLLCNKRVKNGMSYKIPIVSDKVKELLGTGKDFQKIFTPITNQASNRYLKSIMKDLNIEKIITFHRARHSFKTIAARKGMQSIIVERIMGHAEGNDIADIYTHLQNEDIIREMLNKGIA